MIDPTGIGRFHHVGAAVTSIERSQRRLERAGFVSEQSFVDPLQGVRGIFLHDGSMRLELLEALPGNATLDPWLNGDFALYQWAYEVDDIDRALHRAQTAGARLVRAPLPAVAFGGRRVAFVMFVAGAVTEFIDTPA